ncbi:hypothetical protein VR611_12645 [Aquirufa nivalisilvae]
MNDTLIQNKIHATGHSIAKTVENSEQINWWMWLAIAEIGIIIFLIFQNINKPKETPKQRFKNESLNQEIDFKNIVNSSFNSIQLYNELKTKCHPDRFPIDIDKNAIALKLFQEISKNKNNMNKLLELKEEAIQKLSINI